MADLYALDLALDLAEGTPEAVLAEVRRHLAPLADDDGDGDGDGGPYDEPYPLLAGRGPARRVGGVLVGEFLPADRGGWALTARQELHEEELPGLEDFLAVLAPHVRPPGPVGWIRHYEHEVPDLLALRGQSVVRLAPEAR
ncbi:hypothetical protein ACFWUW_10565 [Streptomyces sp. NPDC058655]|uniref:hypothetical protein n=1 Tax=Streptomyces sp. NPDC058655 TaxID=3346577 RepID=UPI00365046D3